jgi:hypothetical protein
VLLGLGYPGGTFFQIQRQEKQRQILRLVHTTKLPKWSSLKGFVDKFHIVISRYKLTLGVGSLTAQKWNHNQRYNRHTIHQRLHMGKYV